MAINQQIAWAPRSRASRKSDDEPLDWPRGSPPFTLDGQPDRAFDLWREKREG